MENATPVQKGTPTESAPAVRMTPSITSPLNFELWLDGFFRGCTILTFVFIPSSLLLVLFSWFGLRLNEEANSSLRAILQLMPYTVLLTLIVIQAACVITIIAGTNRLKLFGFLLVTIVYLAFLSYLQHIIKSVGTFFAVGAILVSLFLIIGWAEYRRRQIDSPQDTDEKSKHGQRFFRYDYGFALSKIVSGKESDLSLDQLLKQISEDFKVWNSTLDNFIKFVTFMAIILYVGNIEFIAKTILPMFLIVPFLGRIHMEYFRRRCERHLEHVIRQQNSHAS